MSDSEEESDEFRYSIEEEVGRGAMGEVLRVRDRDLDRELAMKREVTDLSDREGADGFSTHAVERQARFIEEAFITAQLDHPAIVPIVDLGTDEDGRSFYTMKLVQGVELGEVFGKARREEDGWTISRVLGVLIRVCQAVGYAHGKGVVHRDLKPANIMVGSLGEVYVMDWGLAKMAGREDVRNIRLALEDSGEELDTVSSARTDEEGSVMTMDGAVLGTPAYMPPEQARGDIAAVDFSSDLYAIGAMLYELLAGHPPYLSHGTKWRAKELVRAIREGAPDRLSAEAPAALVAISEKAMSRRREDRYPTALAFAEDLQAFLDQRVVQAYQRGALAEARMWVRRNRGLAGLGACALLALVAGAVVIAVIQTLATERVTDSLERETEALGREREAKHEALNTLAASYAASGLNAVKEGRGAEGALWFLSAKRTAEEERLIEVNRVRTETWLSRSDHTLRALSFPHEIKEVRALASGRHLGVLARPWKLIDLEREEVVPATEAWIYYLDRMSTDGSLRVTPKGEVLTFPKGKEVFRLPMKNPGATKFSRDGRYLVGTGRHDLRVWEVGSWTEGGGYHFEEPVSIERLFFSPSGGELAALDKSGQVWVFGLGSALSLRSTLRLEEIAQSERTSGFSADGSLIGGYSGDQRCFIWMSVSSGQEIRRSSTCRSPSLSDDGSRMLGITENRVKVWDTNTGEELVDLDPASGTHRVVFAGRGNSLVLLKGNGEITHYSSEGTLIGTVEKPELSPIANVEVDPYGKWVATVHGDGLVRVIELPQGRPRGVREIPLNDGEFSRLAFNPGRTLLAPSGHGHLGNHLEQTRVYHLPSLKVAGPILAQEGTLLDAVFSSDEKFLITAVSPARGKERIPIMFQGEGQGGHLVIWDWKEGQRNGSVIPMPSEPRGLAAHERHPHQVGVMCAGGEFATVDLRTRKVTVHSKFAGNRGVGPGNSGDVVFSPDGRFLIPVGMSSSLMVWNVDEGRPQFPPIELTGLFRNLAVEWDAETAQWILASVTQGSEAQNESVQVWELETGRSLARFAVADWIYSCAFSENGQFLVAGGRRRTARVWEWKTGRGVGPDLQHEAMVGTVGFLPGTPWVATGDTGGNYQIWDPRSGTLVAPPFHFPGTPPRMQRMIWEAALFDEGRSVVLANFDGRSLPVIDLGALYPGGTEMLDEEGSLLLAELVAGARLDGGGIVKLTKDEWMGRWQELRKRYPAYHRFPSQP